MGAPLALRLLLIWAPRVAGAAYALYTGLQRREGAEGFQGRRCQVIARRGVTDDVILNTYDFVNITGDELDTTWTDADYEGVEARLVTFYSNVLPNYSSIVRFEEFRWSNLPGNPGVDDPAVRVQPIEPFLVGGSSNHLPPQLASTVTKVVPLRRHWGRVYLGPLGSSAIDMSTGRIHHNFLLQSSIAFQALIEGLASDDTPMVVYDRNAGVAMTVEGCRVDNVPDVVRSRRFHLATERAVLPVPA